MKIIVVSPHPDDETLGAAGTLLKYKAQGHQIYWLNITDIKVDDGWDLEFVEKRRNQIKRICEFFNFDGFYNLQYSPAQLDSVKESELIDEISRCFKQIEPDWVILPDSNDVHSDHDVVFRAGLACTKAFRYPSVKKVTTMEILSETDYGKPQNPFVPNYFVDISAYIDKKIEALKIYDTEIGEPPFPRSLKAIESLANLRGATAGCMYAEAFKIIKMIE